MSKEKCVVMGVTGGIAVYKALDIISALRKKNVDVRVIMTKHAMEFVNPITFQAISQNIVTTDMFEEPKAWEIQHISLAKRVLNEFFCRAFYYKKRWIFCWEFI